ncbi:MAG: nucleotidyltransferase domain-containing protein [Methylococcus sp.]|nr:nucleotidyltransferase domain-containing protein [Methylococcus sp.]
MQPLIREHRQAIAELCRRYDVHRLEVFGSTARGVDFDPARSDAHFLVEFSTESGGTTLKTFFRLQSELSQLLGRAVDLTETSSALRNPYVRASVNRARELVYGALE